MIARFGTLWRGLTPASAALSRVGYPGWTGVESMRAPHFLEPVLDHRGHWGLHSERAGRWLATRAELAGTSSARRRGLIGRDHLPMGHALVIVPTQGIHTFGMRFVLDVVGVARDGAVLTIRRGVGPRRVVVSWRAFAFVELPAGGADLVGLMEGDRLVAIPDPVESG
jgi:uncharacterized membrane protein (UPF0127 family)